MKLISVQSRGDRLVKVWQLRPGAHHSQYRKLSNKTKQLSHVYHKTVEEALKAAEEWLEGART
jgi:hypothetical protein